MLNRTFISPKTEQESVSIDAVTDGRASLERIIDRIDGAERAVTVNMFIWRDDPAGNRTGQALLDAANRGVEVVIIKDKLGALFELGEENRQSFFHKKYGFVTAIKHRVINAYSSRPDLLSWTRQMLNPLVESLRRHRNITIFDDAVRNDHSKYMIVDDRVLFFGGMNFEERIVSTDANGLVWRDYMFECNDEAIVANLRARLSGAPAGNSAFEFLLNDNTGKGRFDVRPQVLELLRDANRTCFIEMAYFCDPEVRDAVICAARRGIDVQIIVPAWANIQNERNLKTMQQIFRQSESAVSIFLSPDMLHSKLMDIDGRSMIVGSANFNERALNRFSELNVLISGDTRYARTIRRAFAERRDASRKITCPDELSYRKVKAFCEYVFG